MYSGVRKSSFSSYENFTNPELKSINSPPFLHLEKQSTRMVRSIVASVQPNHHVIYIIARTVVPLVLHPPEYAITVFNGPSLRQLLHNRKRKTQCGLYYKQKYSNSCTRESEFAKYLNEVGEVLACEAAYPTVE